jgi:myo-inositol-1(or 4)-monophosphatase
MAETAVEPHIDLAFLRSLLVEAGRIALGQRGQMTSMVKADQTPVTEVDRQVEDFLIRRINLRYPDHRILSEESGLHPGNETTTWAIDPIDGTRSFATGLPIWGVSIGILRHDEPVAGGLYMPVTNEMYWGTRQQAYYNYQPLAKIETVDLDSPLVFLAVPSSFHLHFNIRYPRVRALGSTAAHMAYVMTGAAVGSLTRAVYLWDIAGMLPLLTAIGIEMTTLNGEPFQPGEMMDGKKAPEPLLAAHPSVAENLRANIQMK